MPQPHADWLVKTEPDCVSIHDLAPCPRLTTCWSGVRNYQARNFMRDDMQVGDRVLFYHSSADPPAVAGTAIVARAAYADDTAWDPRDEHFDPKASPENPIWQMVDIKLEAIFEPYVPIGLLRDTPALKNMELLRTGSRLSVQPVRPTEFTAVLQLAESLARGTHDAGSARPRAKAVKKKVTKAKPAAPAKKRARAK
jgi:predicted RNA-binding protein with PUA-like domain